ncbi:LysE family translocator [Amycolatopsis thermoflava]|uniref:Threonine/homoserine/homoserine lactone efflux protein n=1 Tax=Amycolatopsis thermoflava TaxID=84480 RepID=A0A3N2GUY9_9PSEU|nr:LysE family translocator [Amycolatopsis thermoflava]ROS40393.1 threonine/homoserine/homoserine lactone efflux protein [Amycolatopsis thermoflava]
MTWLLVFLGAAMLIALTPGANNLLGLHHGIQHGLPRALAGLLGRLAAFTLMIGAVAAGLGQLLAASGPALTAIKWAGVAYLVWLGVKLLRSKPQPPAEQAPGPVLRKEFLVAITNPKAVLIFTAFVPQFVDPAHGSPTAQIAILGAVYLLAEFLAGTAYAAAGAALKSVRLSLRARRNVDRGTGVVLIGMAGTLAAAGS